MIPSGYKEDIVYSAVPTDGSGDLSFTRASNGTRINSAGLVEVVPWNLLTYSQTFSNGAWIDASSGTVTKTSGFADPNGGNTAFKLVGNNASSWIANDIGAVQANNYTFSIWLKTDSTASVDLLMSYGTTDTSTKSITSTWQRYEFTASRSATAGLYGGINVGNGVNIYAWGAQLNIGSTAKPYFPTTDRLNVPRLTYQNGGGGCPSLLLEKQSTNLVTYSEQFDNAGWTKQSGVSVTANQTISPDGTQNADLVVGGGSSGIFQSGLTVSTTVANTKSVYLKGVSGGEVVRLQDPNQTLGYTVCTLTTSWQRFTLSEVQSGGVAGLWVTLIPSGGIYMWGAQLEPSSYPTSYIPTTSASATRVADFSNTSVSSSLLPQASGTIFVQFDWQKTAVDSNILSVHNNSNNLAWITKNSSTQLFGTFFMSGYIGTIQPTISASSGIIKVAYAYTNGSQTMFVNGVEVGTATGTISSSPNFGAVQLNGFWGINKDGTEIQQAVLFQNKLTNAELASLTTI